MSQKAGIVPESFRIAVLTELGKNLEIVEVWVPEELKPGQVLVKVRASGVCASQIHEIDGRKGPDQYIPHTLGHEGVGEVMRVGDGVSTVGPGDTVVLHWRVGSGMNATNATYQSDRGKINAGPVTTFGEYSIVSENRVTALPEAINSDFAPLFGCALTTGFGAVIREANVMPGESAVILGFGGVGIAILKSLQLVSAGPVVVLDIDRGKTDLALSMGAELASTVKAGDRDLADKVRSLLGRKPDVVFELTGNRDLIEQGFAMTQEFGRTVLIGIPQSSEPAAIRTLPLHLGKRLIGSHGGSSKPDVDIPRLGRLIESGYLTLEDFPLATLPFSEINSAIESVRAGIPGRVIVSMITDSAFDLRTGT